MVKEALDALELMAIDSQLTGETHPPWESWILHKDLCHCSGHCFRLYHKYRHFDSPRHLQLQLRTYQCQNKVCVFEDRYFNKSHLTSKMNQKFHSGWGCSLRCLDCDCQMMEFVTVSLLPYVTVLCVGWPRHARVLGANKLKRITTDKTKERIWKKKKKKSSSRPWEGY